MPDKKVFALRLLPPRPTFAFDMTDAERAIMMQHVAYWKKLADDGVALVYGPVMDPAGPYGLGIVEVEDEARLRAIVDADPAVLGGLQPIVFHPMRAVYGKRVSA